MGFRAVVRRLENLDMLIRKRLNVAADHMREFADSGAADVSDAAKLLIKTLENGGKILIFGNGGSAADAQHFAAELVGHFIRERRPLPAVALTSNTSVMTSISNDEGFDHVFSRQVKALANPGDAVIGLSTSGTSPNVVLAAAVAAEIGLKVIGLTGLTKPTELLSNVQSLPTYCDVLITVPSDDIPIVQGIHGAVLHVLCEAIDEWAGRDEEAK